jgi:catechol 2,3-dioxygenase-like lactoylglutathione lyase family enzyme
MVFPIVIGFRHTGIIVKHLKNSQIFYENILGLEVVQDYKDDSKYINDVLGLSDGKIHMVKLKTQDGYIIELLKYVNHPTEILNNPFYNVGNCHVSFTVDNADQMYEKLQNEGVVVISKPLLSSEKTAKVFFCIDPNGIRVELVEMVK